MIKREKTDTKFVIALVLCILLAVAAIGEGVLVLKVNRDYTELKNDNEAQIQELKTQMDEKDAKITSLRKKVKKLSAQGEVQGAQPQKSTDTGEVQGAQPRENTEAQQNEESQQSSEAQNAEEQNVEDQAGALSPSDSGSVFSDSVADLEPGTIIDDKNTAVQNMDSYFTSSMIDRDGAVFQRINGKSYRDNNDISLEDLRYLKLIHYNFNHQVQVGEMIVNAGIQDVVISIFKELFQNEYEVQSIYLVDNYWVEGGDGNDADTASIDQNNTSCFCYRPATGSSNISNHGYGRAIDINPQQNPYVYSGNYSHPNAAPYIDRNCGDPHVIVGNDSDICYSIFTKYGFSWGGNWTDPIDYQHFELPGA